MSTGLEAAQSISITLYYRGFSMIITKRDQSISVHSLIEEAMKGIDWAIGQGLKPSWNEETNKEALKPLQNTSVTPSDAPQQGKQTAAIPIEQFEQTCPNCGAKKILSKKGNLYCENRCWLKDK